MKRTQRGWNSTIRPGKPPVRRKPLSRSRPTRTGQDRRKPEARISAPKPAPAVRWEGWRKSQREYMRSHRPDCEFPGCGSPGTQAHHPFGRVVEPWASSHLVCVRLCDGHHIDIHIGSDVRADRETMRVVSVHRLRTWLQRELRGKGADLLTFRPDADTTRQWFLYAVAMARLHDIDPPGYARHRRPAAPVKEDKPA